MCSSDLDGALRWVARRRDIVVPSLLADRRVEPVAVAEATIDPAAVEAIEELA